MLKRFWGSVLVFAFSLPVEAQIIEYEILSNPQVTIDVGDRTHDIPDILVRYQVAVPYLPGVVKECVFADAWTRPLPEESGGEVIVHRQDCGLPWEEVVVQIPAHAIAETCEEIARETGIRERGLSFLHNEDRLFRLEGNHCFLTLEHSREVRREGNRVITTERTQGYCEWRRSGDDVELPVSALCNVPPITPEPVANAQSGTYKYPFDLVIDWPEGGSTYYTLDGSEPSERWSDPVASCCPIRIDGKVTIKAKSVREGMLDSDVVTWKFRIDPNSDRLPPGVTDHLGDLANAQPSLQIDPNDLQLQPQGIPVPQQQEDLTPAPEREGQVIQLPAPQTGQAPLPEVDLGADNDPTHIPGLGGQSQNQPQISDDQQASLPQTDTSIAVLRGVEARLNCEGGDPLVLSKGANGLWQVPPGPLRAQKGWGCTLSMLYEMEDFGQRRLLEDIELEAAVERGGSARVYVRGDNTVRVAAVPSIGALSVSGAWPVLAEDEGGFSLTLEGFAPGGAQMLYSKPQYFEIGN